MNFDKFKNVLDKYNSWPSDYTFRFIIPFTELKELERILGNEEIASKPSKNGNYLSVVFTQKMTSPDKVIEVYKAVSLIKGIISL